jgi:penicillin-binding protein 2
MIFGFFVLLARLADLQLIKGKYYKVLAEGNRIRRVPIVAARGKIYARGGEVLVGNTEVKKKVAFDLEEGYIKSEDIKGASEEEIITEWERNYPYGSQIAHISGYLGEVSEDEVGKIRAQCPAKGPRRIGSLVGRSGLEQQYDCILSGVDGEELVEVDAQGMRIRTLGRKEPIAGDDIKTTIDIGLQQKVAKLLAEEAEIPSDRKGAFIATDMNGEVLAYYSSPSYDPNVFIKGDAEGVSALLEDERQPLFSRVIGGRYHPGSVYKPVVAIAALEEGKIDDNYTYVDNGRITIESIYGDYTFNNWYFTQYGRTEGEIDVVKAIARSTDTFFYKVGELVGIDRLYGWSQEFGLDANTKIDIPGEVAGLIPSPEWKEEVKGERWFLGNTYHMSIGQGDIAVTPVALNAAIGAIANRGNLCPPHILHDVSSGECKQIQIDEKSAELVIKGMVDACSSGGTAYTFFDFKEKREIDVACKTGTAETDDFSEDTHAWFTVFAPAGEREEDFKGKEIVATVLVEKGGEGSKVAGPIAREVFDYWFESK